MNNKLQDNSVGSFDEYIKNQLKDFRKEELFFIRKWIWEGIFHFPLFTVSTKRDSKLSESEILKGHFALKKVLEGCPIQYVVGEVPFVNVVLQVNSSVLIPRPETEELVVKMNAKVERNVARVLDLGTGSGCIAISLAKSNPHWKVTACDISSEALELARINGKFNQVVIDWKCADFRKLNAVEGIYDILISNPPYIPIYEKDGMDRGVVDYEPHLALFTTNEDPLEYYRAIKQISNQQLSDKGWVGLEVHHDFVEQVVDLWRHDACFKVSVEKDLQGKDRFVFAQLHRNP
jgi:release factor glutamine methyltransferase